MKSFVRRLELAGLAAAFALSNCKPSAPSPRSPPLAAGSSTATQAPPPVACTPLPKPKALLPAAGKCVVTVGAYKEKAFGGSWLGELVWVSHDGRWVLGYQVRPEDGAWPGSDGGATVESQGRLGLWLFDTANGSDELWDSLVDYDDDGRFALLRRSGVVWLFDADGERRSLEELASQFDPVEHSLTDRHLWVPKLGTSSDRIGFVRAAPERGIVRDLTSCEEDTFSTPGPLWRVLPTAVGGWARLLVVRDTNHDGRIFFPIDPELRYSPGAGGSLEDRPAEVLVSTHGARFERGALILLSNDLLLNPLRSVLDGEGKDIQLPEGCAEPLGVEGMGAVILRCGDKSALWSPPAAPRRLPVAVFELAGHPRFDAMGRGWIHARSLDHDGRVALDDGSWQPVPDLAVNARGWLTASTANTVEVVHIGTGRRATLNGTTDVGPRGKRVFAPLAARIKNRWTAIDPIRCRAVPVPAKPLAVSEGGCAFFASGAEGRFERGPWFRRCPR